MEERTYADDGDANNDQQVEQQAESMAIPKSSQQHIHGEGVRALA